MKVRDLRKSFIDYFVSKQHKHVHSSSLLPKDDPTLLFTTAGMVQFKAMFAGTVKLDYTRATTVQKCLRTSDLENVGRTKRHCTFFEMLGNFSFGDYFKEEAIAFAWEYSTQVLKLDSNKIWASIYQDDDEAFEIWNKKVGLPAERIVRLGKKDNFWGPAGDSGACGPCSELYIDKGPELGCGSPDCKPGCDCERYMEYWNLVFNQFNQDTSGKLHPLPQTGIDTGMGLERLATIVQNKTSIYETDEFQTLIEFVCKELNVKYEGGNIVPINVIVEHSRALTFAMSDGAYPSNEGRGYVLRRILRRALRFGRQIGITKPFIYKMVDPISALLGEFYPEITEAKKNVQNVLEGEEKRFLDTLENGMTKLDEIIESALKNGKVISGKDAFLLYDTFGFPVEMTSEIALEKEISVNMKEFEDEMNKQRERGKQSWKASDASFDNAMNELSKTCGATVFKGYDEDSSESKIISISDGKSIIDSVSSGNEAYMVLAETPFYAESGGQSCDTGFIKTSNAVFKVSEVKKVNKTFVHFGTVESGSFKKGDKVTAEIDSVRRNLTRANHTVTHLLQAALREVLGTHVKQAGSMVESERMRFDFSHFEAMTADEISRVENIVNTKIWENLPVTTQMMNLADALKTGAMAEFGEKYEDNVRVVKAGSFSTELCGGTHVDNTGKIGVFKILKESSPGAGIRRIEGLTLKGVLDRFAQINESLSGALSIVNCAEKDLSQRIKDLQQKNKDLEAELAGFSKGKLADTAQSLLSSAEKIKGTDVITSKIENLSGDDLKTLADLIRERSSDCALILISSFEGKVIIVAAATQAAVSKGADSGALIKAVAPILGGGGGGRKDMAQAGGKDFSKADEAIASAKVKLSEMIK